MIRLSDFSLKKLYTSSIRTQNAPQPRSSSFTWRSMCFGMQLMKAGVCWSVGDGKLIKVLADYCILMWNLKCYNLGRRSRTGPLCPFCSMRTAVHGMQTLSAPFFDEEVAEHDQQTCWVWFHFLVLHQVLEGKDARCRVRSNTNDDRWTNDFFLVKHI